MLKMIPHYDPRAGYGQRFDNWSSLIFYNPVLVSTGDPYTNEYNAGGSVAMPPPFDIYLANSGSLNVRGVIPSNTIRTIVIGVAWVAKIGEHAPVETVHGTFPAPLLAGGTGSPSGLRSARQPEQPNGIRFARQPGQASGSSSARPAHSFARRLSSKTTVDLPDLDISLEDPRIWLPF